MANRAASQVDGRVSRSVRSRSAICESCLDLLQEGVLQPSADQIADRAGLSRRSVFNHFRDLAELYDAVFDVGLQRCAPLLKEISRDEPIGRRIELWAEARSKFLEATSPFTRALTAQALSEVTGAQAWRVSQMALEMQRHDVERLFEAELEPLPEPSRLELLDVVSVSTSPLAWELLRHSRGLSMHRARAAMVRALTALLRDAGVKVP